MPLKDLARASRTLSWRRSDNYLTSHKLTMLVHRLITPFGAVPKAGRRGERDAEPEARESRPLRVPEGFPVHGDVLEEGSSQRALELNEPGIGSHRWLLRGT